MEINTYTQNTTYQTQTTSKAKNNNSANLESFADKIDTSNSVIKQPVVYDERAELEKYPYFQQHPEFILPAINKNKFIEAQSQLPWEDKLAHPFLTYDFDTYQYEDLGYLQKENPDKYIWMSELSCVTNENKYDGAPEYKAFVDKWMNNGLTEYDAICRASLYVKVGLLDYGSQRADFTYWDMPPTDTKQHGMWLIDNPPLKKAMLDIFDSLDSVALGEFIDAIFNGYPENSNSAEQTSFQELLTKYGVKLEDLKQKDPQFAKENPEVFNGDINLKNDNSKESQAYNNFIFKTIVGFFKDRIESLDSWEQKHPEYNLSSIKKSINLLIENFQEKVDSYNENIQDGKSQGKK